MKHLCRRTQHEVSCGKESGMHCTMQGESASVKQWRAEATMHARMFAKRTYRNFPLHLGRQPECWPLRRESHSRAADAESIRSESPHTIGRSHCPAHSPQGPARSRTCRQTHPANRVQKVHASHTLHIHEQASIPALQPLHHRSVAHLRVWRYTILQGCNMVGRIDRLRGYGSSR